MHKPFVRGSGLGVITSSVPLLRKRDRKIDNLPVSDLLRRMKPGDSVCLPRVERENLYGRAKQIGIRVSVRLVEPEVIRVWRVE